MDKEIKKIIEEIMPNVIFKTRFISSGARIIAEYPRGGSTYSTDIYVGLDDSFTPAIFGELLKRIATDIFIHEKSKGGL